jgi:heat shock protein HtpX
MLSGRGPTIIFVFIGVYAILFWGVGMAFLLFGNNLWGLLIGVGVGVVLAVIAVRKADSILLKVARATRLNPGKYPGLHEAVKTYALKYQIPIPELYVSPEMLPDFYVFGSSLERCAFVFTRGFLDRAQPQFFEAAVAWAVVSAKRGSLQVRTLGSVLAYIIMLPAKVGDFLSMGSSSRYNILNLMLLVPMAPLAALIVHVSGSKRDIHETDQETGNLIGDQAYLGVTLIEIDKTISSFTIDTDLALIPLFIAPPMCSNFYYNMFRPFPPLSKRINRLRMQRRIVQREASQKTIK